MPSTWRTDEYAGGPRAVCTPELPCFWGQLTGTEAAPGAPRCCLHAVITVASRAVRSAALPWQERAGVPAG
jgi:hypothetical protein